MLTRDALLAYAHFICVFALASLLVGELLLLRKTLPAQIVRALQAVDSGVKGAAFYTRFFIPLCAVFMARGF